MKQHPFQYLAIFCTLLALSACSTSRGPTHVAEEPCDTDITSAAPENKELSIPPTGTKETEKKAGDENSAQNSAAHTGTRIALLAPMTGPAQKSGSALLQSAQLALFDAGDAGSAISLMPIDTHNTDAGAIAAFKEAKEAGADIILARISAQAGHALHEYTKDGSAPVIALSNDASLAQDGMLVLGSTLAEQVEYVVDYANNNNIHQASLLVPATDTGHAATESVKSFGLNNSFKIGALEEYHNVKGDVVAGLNHILAKPAVAAADTATKSEALLMPEGGSALISFIGQLKRQPEVSKRFQLLGTANWDDESFSHEKALLGGWFATNPPELRKQFEDRFQTTYSYRPMKAASLAYDAVLVAVSLSKNGGVTKAALMDTHGFNGINGLFRFNADGLAEHSLVVEEITEYGFATVETGPDSF